MDPIISLTAVDMANAIANGTLSSTEVVAAHLDRIEDVNADINAIVAPRDRDEVMADAAAADAASPVGPLHGLPVAVKDLEAVAGLPTRSGSVVTSEQPATADGHIAAQLRRAGAIIVGKTNTPEFGTGSHTFNEVYGLTRNPWDLGRSAGGSSGGAAAALAARMLPIADGSDFGGSLRNPAGFCNVVGIRPSIGRVADPASRSTHLMRLGVRGPMGRTVADAALVMAALAGPHADDPLSLTDDPATLRKAGVMDLPLIQRYINFWYSSALDLFGAEISSNAATYFANGLKGRPDEKTFEDHDCSETVEKIETPDGQQEVATRNAMNYITRAAYTQDCGIGLKRWNRQIAKAGFDFELALPSDRFHRKVGLWADMTLDTDGKPCSPDAIVAALPSEADRAYVKALMVGVTEPGKCANWTTLPDRGINNQPVDFEYVRAA